MKKILLLAAVAMVLLFAREGFCKVEIVDPGGNPGGGGAHTYIKVIHAITKAPIPGASVRLESFGPSCPTSGGVEYINLGSTNQEGKVMISDEIMFRCGSYFHILVYYPGNVYYEGFDGHPFTFGETFVMELRPLVYCGDLVCHTASENVQNCPADCSVTAVCPNGICEIREDQFNCPQDCQRYPVTQPATQTPKPAVSYGVLEMKASKVKK